MKPQVYLDPRPAEYFARFHERARNRRPDVVYAIVRLLVTPYLALLHRPRCIDAYKVPDEGAAIISPNHFSFLDHFFVAIRLRRRVQFMAKSQLFRRPLQAVLTHGGVFPVCRGRRDDEAFKTAHAVLARGDVIVMYSEGGRSRSGKLGKPKPGIGKLALESGAVVIPTAVVGTAKVRNWKRLEFPRVTVRYGDPIRFERVDQPTREQAQATSEAIFAEVRKLYRAVEEAGRA